MSVIHGIDFLKEVPALSATKRKFLVTGAAGFIGSHLVDVLLQCGQSVLALDNLVNGIRANLPPDGTTDFSFVQADICDAQAMAAATDGVDCVLHQAAIGSVPRSIAMPELYQESNVGGFFTALRCAQQNGVRRFVYASSSSVYGDTTTRPNREGFEGSPLSPYAGTKAINEVYGKAFHKAYGIETVGLRYFNVFGPRQNPKSQYAAVIPAFVAALLARKPPVINGDGSISRDFTFIGNVVLANLLACFAPSEAVGKSYNVACGQSTSIQDLFNQIQSLLKSDVDAIQEPARAGDVQYSCANIELANTMLGYEPKITINKGLEQTVRWYARNAGV